MLLTSKGIFGARAQVPCLDESFLFLVQVTAENKLKQTETHFGKLTNPKQKFQKWPFGNFVANRLLVSHKSAHKIKKGEKHREYGGEKGGTGLKPISKHFRMAR